MIDLSYIQNPNSNTQIFQNGGTWQTWVKPKNAKIVYFTVAGSGGGGGGGFLAPTGIKTGGAGGGSCAVTKLAIQAILVPDILYIYAAKGGQGGLGGVAGASTRGASGENSVICLQPDFTFNANIFTTSGTSPATGGQTGSLVNSAGGIAEATTLVSIQAKALFTNLGNYTISTGVSGTSGGAAGGISSTVLNFVQAATGGGGTAGGGIGNGTEIIPTTPSSLANTNGSNGITMYKPLFLRGGTGAGGGTNGGKGGNGAPGTGGGGGGAGTVSAGNGGNGGDGFVIITTNF